MRFLVSTLLLLLVITSTVTADRGDDTVEVLKKSPLVISGEITMALLGLSGEQGVVNYTCDFRVDDVYKGNATLKSKVIRVGIVRFEQTEADQTPLIKKNSRCVLFLRPDPKSIPEWKTVDPWFGIMAQNSMMQKSLNRVATPRGIRTFESNAVNLERQSLHATGKNDFGLRLENIVARVTSVLPNGWSAGLELGRGGSERAPTIVIRTNDAVAVSYAIPGAPSPKAAVSTSMEVISIEYVLRKSMTPAEYKIANATNRRNTQRRVKFQREQLKQSSSAHKGSPPIPPAAFQVTTTEDQKLLTQYACLWIDTPVESLPTHYADALSFERVAQSTQIKERRIGFELKEIEKRLNKIFTPYE